MILSKIPLRLPVPAQSAGAPQYRLPPASRFAGAARHQRAHGCCHYAVTPPASERPAPLPSRNDRARRHRLIFLKLILGIGFFTTLRAEIVSFDLTSASIRETEAAFASNALNSETLTQLFLNRIAAYDKQGPSLHAIITLNPLAVAEARALDMERRAKGPRGPLHGIPVLIKDNIDVAGLPTTGGSYALRNSVARTDSEQVRRLRQAGCVILGKTNMSEFASGAAISTLGGQMRNPYALDHSPRGSSGGSAVGVAAVFATFALGTDTGGSIRRPSTANDIVGLKPTFGLNGRGGIMPLALSLDTVGPMARHVADVALAMNVMAGPDPRDPATVESAAKRAPDYTAELKSDALKGVRLGLLRDWMGRDQSVDAIMDAAIELLRSLGAEVIDVRFPRYVLGLGSGLYDAIHNPEFRQQIGDYLAALPGEDLPRNIDDLVRCTEKITAPTPEGWVPNPARLKSLKTQAAAGTLQDAPYLAALHEGRKIIRENWEWIMNQDKLDAFIVPTSSRPPELIANEPPRPPDLAGSVDQFSNVTGWPELVVPAGFTSNPALPVGLSFIGPAFSEARLLGYGYAFENAHAVRLLPSSTPQLPGEHVTYQSSAPK